MTAERVAETPLGATTTKAAQATGPAAAAANADPFNPGNIQNYRNSIQNAQSSMKALEDKYEDRMTSDEKTLLRYMMASQIQNPPAGQNSNSGSKSASSSSSSSTPKAANIPQGIGPVGQISVPKVSDVNILNPNPPAAPTQPRGETQVLRSSDGKKVPVTIVDSLDPSPAPSAPSVDTSKPPEAFGLRTFISEPINRSSSTLTLDDSVQKATAPHADSADRGVASSYVGTASVPRADASSTKASTTLSAKMKEKLAKLLAKNNGKNATADAAGASGLSAGSGSPEAGRGLVVFSGKSGGAGDETSEDAFSEFNGTSRPGRYRTPNPKGDLMGPDVRKRGLASLDSVKSLWNDGYDGNRWILIGLAGLVALLAAGKKVTGDRRSRVRVSSSRKK